MVTGVVEVRIWNERVGAVALDPELGAYVFEYAPSWRRRGVELSPLMMPTTANVARFAFPELSRASYAGLPGLLADALPDAFGNNLIDAWMATHGIDKASVTTLDRLMYMGKRGMGALEFKPAKGSHREAHTPLQMKLLVEAARRAIRADFGEDDQAQAALAQIIRVGTSAGGARAKAVVAWNPTTEELRSGQFDVDIGWEHWLLKFDGLGSDAELGESQSYGRIEYAYYLMATAAGIVMMPSRLLTENGRAHFMTKRFDRENNRKHHVQSLCALQHMDYKQRGTHAYESLFLTCERLRLGDDAREQIFLRMAFNVAARNCDDHSKNFAFILKEGELWALAPAYDVTFAHNPQGEWTHQHLMSVNGKFDGITRADLLTIADRFSVPKPSKLLARIHEAVGEWRRFAASAGVPAPDVERTAREHASFAV